MKNLLAKLSNRVKSLFTSNQKSVSPEKTLKEGDVAPCIDIPVITPPSKHEKDSNFIFQSFKSLSTDYILIITEMRNLLDSENKKFVFYALSTQSNIDEVASHLKMSSRKVIFLYQEAITEINIKTGFVREYLDNGIRKDNEIKKLKSKLQVLKAQLTGKTIEPYSEEEDTPVVFNLLVNRLLLKSISQCLDLEIRTINVLKAMDIETLEDLLKFSLLNGLGALTKQRNFGNSSLEKLKKELLLKGIFDADGYCDYYRFISIPKQPETTMI